MVINSHDNVKIMFNIMVTKWFKNIKQKLKKNHNENKHS
jgi:hypothetical protein